MGDSTTSQYIVNLPVGMGCSDFDWSHKPDLDTLVHRQLLCDMTARIERNVSLACDMLRKRDGHSSVHRAYPAFNMNYLVTGVRGSGKSVFMDLLVKCLTRDLDPFDRREKPLRRFTPERYIDSPRRDVRCRFLCHYDPTSGCNQSGFFFLYLLSCLQTILDDIIAEGRVWGERQDGCVNVCKDYLKRLNKGAVRLSMGKQAFGQLTEYQSFHMRADDPELDRNIRDNFAGALDALCKLCGVDAFIVSVDDADTRTEQCFRVLEELRLYISNPRLIVLVAGDMSLYTERVREQYFREYNYDFHQADEEGKAERMNAIVSHAGQYMIKLFPLMHQYELVNILTMTGKSDPISIHLRGKTSQGAELPCEKQDLVSIVRKVFGAVICSGGPDVEPYVKQFCCLPLRSIIHILNFWTVHSLWDSWNYIEYVNDKKPDKDAYVVKPNDNHPELNWEYRHVVRTVQLSLIRALTDEIHHADCKFTTVNVEERRMLFALMLRHCQNMNDLEHGYFLSGDIGRSTTDKFTTLLLAVASRSVTDTLDGFLFYLLFGPATVSLFAKAVEQSCRELENRNAIAISELREKFDRYLHVGSWSSPTRWARHANMIWCLDGNFEGLHSGVLRLRIPAMARLVQDVMFSVETSVQKQKHFHDASRCSTPQQPDAIIKQEEKRFCQSIAVLVSMSKSSDRDNSYFISVFSLLAFIMKCIQRCDYIHAIQQDEDNTDANQKDSKNVDENKTDARTLCKKEISDIIRDYSPVKVCRNPEWLIRKDDIKMFNTYNIDTESFLDKHDGLLEKLSHEIVNWYTKHIRRVPDPEKAGADTQSTETATGKTVNNGVSDQSAKDCGQENQNATSAPQPLKNNLTPRRMGQKWSDWYYGMKQISYQVKSCSLENFTGKKSDEVYRFLLTDSDCMARFHDIAKHFRDSFCTPEKGENEEHTIHQQYCEALSEFPLVEAFVQATERLSESWNSPDNHEVKWKGAPISQTDSKRKKKKTGTTLSD